MNAIFKGAVGFVVGYLVLMVPTYVLPYLGSNSAMVGAIGAMIGRGFTPQFWLHSWCLVMLVLVTSIRARNIGKGWLMIFPVTAGFFDLVPGLSLIPLVPTVMHLLALVLGAMGSAAVLADTEDAPTRDAKDFSWEPWAAGLMTLSAISGAFHFMYGVKASGKQTQVQSAPVPSSPKAESVKASSASTAQTKANTSAPQTDASGHASRLGEATALATHNSKPLIPKPQAKKMQDPAQLSHSEQPKKVEGKATVRLIDINN